MGPTRRDILKTIAAAPIVALLPANVTADQRGPIEQGDRLDNIVLYAFAVDPLDDDNRSRLLKIELHADNGQCHWRTSIGEENGDGVPIVIERALLPWDIQLMQAITRKVYR